MSLTIYWHSIQILAAGTPTGVAPSPAAARIARAARPGGTPAAYNPSLWDAAAALGSADSAAAAGPAQPPAAGLRHFGVGQSVPSGGIFASPDLAAEASARALRASQQPPRASDGAGRLLYGGGATETDAGTAAEEASARARALRGRLSELDGHSAGEAMRGEAAGFEPDEPERHFETHMQATLRTGLYGKADDHVPPTSAGYGSGGEDGSSGSGALRRAVYAAIRSLDAGALSAGA